MPTSAKVKYEARRQELTQELVTGVIGGVATYLLQFKQGDRSVEQLITQLETIGVLWYDETEASDSRPSTPYIGLPITCHLIQNRVKELNIHVCDLGMRSIHSRELKDNQALLEQQIIKGKPVIITGYNMGDFEVNDPQSVGCGSDGNDFDMLMIPLGAAAVGQTERVKAFGDFVRLTNLTYREGQANI